MSATIVLTHSNMTKKNKKKVNPWKDWQEYEEKNMLDKVLQDITDFGWDEAIKRNKVEDWFIPKLIEHIDWVS